MKKFQLIALLAVVTSLFFVACSKSDDPTPEEGGGASLKVTYKVIASDNVAIDAISYVNGSPEGASENDISGTTWTSEELNVPKEALMLYISASGSTLNNEDGELTVQILVDGKVVAEGEETGSFLLPDAAYDIEQ